MAAWHGSVSWQGMVEQLSLPLQRWLVYFQGHPSASSQPARKMLWRSINQAARQGYCTADPCLSGHQPHAIIREAQSQSILKHCNALDGLLR